VGQNSTLPLRSTKRNIEALIKHESVTAHQPKIILATPPPIDETRQEEVDATKGLGLCRRASITAQYAEAVREVAAEIGGDVILLDLWSVLMVEAAKHTSIDDLISPIIGTKELGSNKALTDLLPDGLHFGSTGYAKFYESLISAVESKWPNSLGSYVLPEWRAALKME
jgi:isoamyl acetate esterase